MKDMAAVATCKQEPGVFVPVIDLDRCEGKGPCVPACPYDVLEMGVLPAAQRGALSFKGKVKSFAHGWKKAFVRDADACRACGACVAACPEHAITLARRLRA